MNDKIKIPVQDFINYEMDALDEEKIIEFFQRLVNSKLAWVLGGHYAIIAAAFLKENVIKGEVPEGVELPDLPEL